MRLVDSVLILGTIGFFEHDAFAQSQAWIRYQATLDNDFTYGAAPYGSGGAYWCGSTGGAFGSPYIFDAWLARYNGTGSELWIRNLVTAADDRATCAATDGAGGVFVGGWSGGTLGGPNAGGQDAWLARHDGAGTQVWIR